MNRRILAILILLNIGRRLITLIFLSLKSCERTLRENMNFYYNLFYQVPNHALVSPNYSAPSVVWDPMLLTKFMSQLMHNLKRFNFVIDYLVTSGSSKSLLCRHGSQEEDRSKEGRVMGNLLQPSLFSEQVKSKYSNTNTCHSRPGTIV